MSRLTINYTVQTADTRTNVVSVVPSAAVSVFKRNADGSRGSASTIYQSPSGSITLTQPIASDLQGRIPGWLDPGDYSISVSAPGFTTYEIGYSIPSSFTPVSAVTTLTGLTQGAETQVSLNLPATACLLYSFEASVACRARIYATTLQATADISRNQNVDPVGNVGCLLEMAIGNATAGAPWQLSPEVTLVEQDASPTAVYPGIVRCDSGTSVTITVYGFIIEP